MEEKKYHAINWTDGVKITKEHFIENDHHMHLSMQRHSKIQITPFNYGLLEPKSDNVGALDLSVDATGSEQLVLKLRACNAITANGCKIEFESDMYGGEEPTKIVDSSTFDKNVNMDFYIIVSINPYKSVPVGEPDPDQIPLHHPYALPTVGLELLPVNQYNANFLKGYFLIVGKAYWRNGDFMIDQDYLPPVARVSYDKKMREVFHKITAVLVNLKNYSLVINSKNRFKFASNPLARNTFSLAKKVLDFSSANLFYFKQKGVEMPPIHLAEKINELASYISIELQLLDEVEKEKLLQYFYEWIDVKPSVFESTLKEVISFQYNHQEIEKMVGVVANFMQMMERLWKKLSDLEYIGQRKDNIVVSEEKEEVKETPKNRSWSIID